MEKEGEEPVEEEEGENPADDGDGDAAVQEVRTATHASHSIDYSHRSELSSASPPPAPTVPSRSSRLGLKVTLKLPPKPKNRLACVETKTSRTATSNRRTMTMTTSILAVGRATALDYTSGRAGERRRVISCFTGYVSDYSVVFLAVI